MKAITHLTVAIFASACCAFPHPPGHYGGKPWGWGGKKAIYFLRVDPSGSSIVAIGVDQSGMLTDSTSVTSTSGIGQQSQNASSPDLSPTAIDPLQGQQAVSIGDNYLFTINSGSDTAVMFEIDASNPLRLTMVGQPAPTLGEFAMAIAYSSKYKKACVLNGGAVNGVTCYSVDPTAGLVADGVGLREFGFPATTPAQLGGAKGSGSDIQFTGDSSKVISAFKGRSKPHTTLGHISVFDVDSNGNVAGEATDNRVSPIIAPFGFALNGDNLEQIYVTDATFGGVLVSLDSETDKISALSVVNDTSFAASCWAVWDSATDTFYDINAASNVIGTVDSSGKLTGTFEYAEELGGGVDSVIAGDKLYMMAATNAIAVIETGSQKVLQTFNYSSADDRPHWTGLAMFPAEPLLSGAMG